MAGQEKLSFPGDREFDPFYDIQVEMADGTLVDLTAAAFHDIEDRMKYFLWIRRGTDSGIVTYALELNRIRSITFTDLYGSPDYGFTPAELELTNGSSYEVFVDTNGYLGGFDREFGSYARVFLHYNLVSRITMKQDGSYRLCPHCGTVFYAGEIDVCPFDKTPLILPISRSRSIP